MHNAQENKQKDEKTKKVCYK